VCYIAQLTEKFKRFMNRQIYVLYSSVPRTLKTPWKIYCFRVAISIHTRLIAVGALMHMWYNFCQLVTLCCI
jgi:hypothetical protein